MNINKINCLKRNGISFSILNQTYKLLGLNKKKLNITLKLNKKNIFNKIFTLFTYNETLKIKLEKQISYYKNLKSYRGMRHVYKYPVRGQRTHTNAKTQKKLKLITMSQSN
jgi:ribosomal protein S13